MGEATVLVPSNFLFRVSRYAGVKNVDIRVLSSVTFMCGRLSSDGYIPCDEISFKFKGGCTLDDLALDFCTDFEERKEGRWPSIKRTDLVSGRLTLIEASRTWIMGGTSVALLIFYSLDEDQGGAAIYIYGLDTRDSSEGYSVNKIYQQIEAFFQKVNGSLVELENRDQLKIRNQEPSGSQTDENERDLREGWLTPIRFCEKCGAAIAIDESSFCWNCGIELPHETGEEAEQEEGTQRGGVHCDEVGYDRRCMICKLEFKDGELLAWCPHCGAPAHRIHMLEWMHVKGSCPACGQQLEIQKMEEQLSQAHLQRSSKTTLQARKKDAKPKKH